MKILLVFATCLVLASTLLFLANGFSWVHAHPFDETFEKIKKADPKIVQHRNGMLIKVLEKGAGGKSPRLNDRCKCHYSGWLVNKADGSDGNKFDSSVDRGQPFVSAPSGVIEGWKSILQEMREGDKVKIWLPPNLAYGDRGAGGLIPGGAALTFEMSLIQVVSGGKSAEEAREAFKKSTGKDFDEIEL